MVQKNLYSIIAEITLNYKTEKEAKAIAKAITPDNEETPIGLSVKTSIHHKTIITKVYCDKGVKTLLSTLDDLLSCSQIAEKAIKATEAT